MRWIPFRNETALVVCLKWKFPAFFPRVTFVPSPAEMNFVAKILPQAEGSLDVQILKIGINVITDVKTIKISNSKGFSIVFDSLEGYLQITHWSECFQFEKYL